MVKPPEGQEQGRLRAGFLLTKVGKWDADADGFEHLYGRNDNRRRHDS